MHSERAFLTAKRNAYQHVTRHDWRSAAQDLGALSKDARFSAQDWLSLAIASIHAGSLPDAAQAAKRALADDPDNFRVLQVLSIALMEQHRWAEAAELFERHGHRTEAQASFSFLVNQGTALWQLRRPKEALDAFLRALSLNLSDPSLHLRVGLVLKDLKMYDEAAESFLTTVALQPDRLSARLMAIHMRQYACDWRDFDSACADAVTAMARLDPDEPERGEGATFALLAIPHPPSLFKIAAQQAAAFHTGQAQPLPAQTRERDAAGRIRIGYLSC
ncbi:MAG: tetratricopeptide repeat protein, partial [Burkholderiaceae bacterium]|nr:tetratricopeptide repeat protein [Burkholderiaceae bacterium]